MTFIFCCIFWFSILIIFKGVPVKSVNDFYVTYDKEGLYAINKEEISLHNINDPLSYSWTKVHYIWLTDRVISKYNSQIENNTITLQNGLFLLQINNTFQNENNKKIIKINGYDILVKTPGTIFINSLDNQNALVYSLNSQADIQFRKRDKDEQWNEIFLNEITNTIKLFPHSYIRLNPKKNNWVEPETDRLRISQIFSVFNYFYPSLLEGEDEYSKLMDILSMKDVSIQSEILSYFETLEILNIRNNSQKEEITKFKNYSLPWENTITKYTSLFLNKEKKKVYYENLILRNLQALILENKENWKAINNISKNLWKLSNFAPESYEKMKNIIFYFYQVILFDNGSTIAQSKNILQLYNKIQDSHLNIKWNAPLLLRNAFYQYDYTSQKTFYEDINKFLTDYNKQDLISEEKIDYLLFFIEKVLISDKNNENIELSNIIKLFNSYADISYSYYQKAQSTTIKTWIYINSDILQNIWNISRKIFFEEDRNTNGLLVTKSLWWLNIDEIMTLESNIQKIMKIYNDNKNVLDLENKKYDQVIQWNYSDFQKQFTEYFLALNSPKEYRTKYDQVAQTLITSNNNSHKEVITKEKAMNYISQFEWITSWNYSIMLRNYDYCMNPIEENLNTKQEIECYEVKNLNINNKQLSFIVFPYNGNTIDNIKEYKNGSYTNIGWSYNLDQTKEILDEKYRSSRNLDLRNKYDFKKFFLNTFKDTNTFVNNTEEESKNTQENEEFIEEDSIVRTFKRNILLGSNGDFTEMSDFFDVNYNDVIVQRDNSNEYNIYINKAELNWSKKVWFRVEEIKAILSSEYTSSGIKSFFNLSLKYINTKLRNDTIMLNDNPINIKWVIPKENLKNIFFEVYNGIWWLENISNNINNELWVKDLTIAYNPEFKEYKIHFLYQSTIWIITIKNSNIIDFEYNKQNLLNKEINTREINTLLNLIK